MVSTIRWRTFVACAGVNERAPAGRPRGLASSARSPPRLLNAIHVVDGPVTHPEELGRSRLHQSAADRLHDRAAHMRLRRRVHPSPVCALHHTGNTSLHTGYCTGQLVAMNKRAAPPHAWGGFPSHRSPAARQARAR